MVLMNLHHLTGLGRSGRLGDVSRYLTRRTLNQALSLGRSLLKSQRLAKSRLLYQRMSP